MTSFIGVGLDQIIFEILPAFVVAIIVLLQQACNCKSVVWLLLLI